MAMKGYGTTCIVVGVVPYAAGYMCVIFRAVNAIDQDFHEIYREEDLSSTAGSWPDLNSCENYFVWTYCGRSTKQVVVPAGTTVLPYPPVNESLLDSGAAAGGSGGGTISNPEGEDDPDLLCVLVSRNGGDTWENVVTPIPASSGYRFASCDIFKGAPIVSLYAEENA